MRWTPTTLTNRGETIYYEVTEPAAPRGTVVLGHGAGGSHAAWFQQVPALAAAGWRVVTWDTRGFGRSTFASGEFTLEASVADLAAVLAATDTERAHIVGQSMGGWWATGFALAHPERVASLVLANTVGGLWTAALEEYFRGWAASGAATGAADQLGRHAAIGPQLGERDPALAFLYQQLNTFHSPPMGPMVGVLVGTRFDARLVRDLPCAKLWITSTHDDLFPAELVVEPAMAIDARRIVIHDAGHSPYFERATVWNAELLAFLDGIEPITPPR